MRRPRIVDLFCYAGGAGMGLYRAGFDVVGVDIEPQPNYPFEFVCADALGFDLAGFDAVWASPPCQRFTRVQALGEARNGGYPDTHLDLVEPTRAVLRASGLPYIIENVVGAPLIDPITLCGKTFGLKVYRHRLFESNVALTAPPHEPHNDSTPSAGNGKSPKGFISVAGSGGVRGMNAAEIVAYWSYAMGIDWMTRRELAQAVPPVYAEWNGRQLLAAVRA